MNGIVSSGTYLPYRRLDRAGIAAVAGSGGGRGTRTVSSYDEDTTTMGVEAGRRALRSSQVEPRALWFSTASPVYLDKTNATALHAALRLDRPVPAYDALGSVRSAMGALRAALGGAEPALVVASDIRTGLPGGAEETNGGDAAGALLVGSTDAVAELAAWESSTEEFLDRWRTPGDVRSKTWEERFGETRYVPLAVEAWESALKGADLAAEQIDHLVVTGMHDRAVAATVKKLGVPAERVVDTLGSTVGNTGAAHPFLLLAAALESAAPGEIIAMLVLADGADAVLLRTTEAIASWTSGGPSVLEQIASGAEVSYGRYLAWRGLLPVEPSRRPDPARPSASAAGRSREWKFGFVASQGAGGEVHLPPSPLDRLARPMAEARGTIVTFTTDRLAYSPSPPVIFAVVDFEDGGRLPVELTDIDPEEVEIGMRVEMTFRRLFSADGIANYFWKARPLRSARR